VPSVTLFCVLCFVSGVAWYMLHSKARAKV